MYNPNETSFNDSVQDKINPTLNPKWNINPNDFLDVQYFKDLDYLHQPWIEDPVFYPTTIVYGLAYIVGVFGNALVAYALLVDKKAHNATNIFLVSLAMADILFLLLIVPYEMAFKLAGYWSGVRVFCKLSAFIEMMTAVASILNLTAVSVERYIVIVHPLRSRSLCSLGNTRKTVVLVWCLAVILSLPCFMVYDTETHVYYNEDNYFIDCRCAIKASQKPAMAWYQTFVMFILPIVILVFCYSVVISVLWNSTRELASLTQNSTQSSALRSSSTKSASPTNKDQGNEMVEARKQVIRMLLAIIAVFLVCWGPKLILQIIKSYSCQCLHNSTAFIAGIIINLLPYLQSASNPIIYGFMSKNFRQSMRTALRTCGHCKRKDHFMGRFDGCQGFRTTTYTSGSYHSLQLTNYTSKF